MWIPLTGSKLVPTVIRVEALMVLLLRCPSPRRRVLGRRTDRSLGCWGTSCVSSIEAALEMGNADKGPRGLEMRWQGVGEVKPGLLR